MKNILYNLRNWLNAQVYGSCDICRKPLTDKLDNKSRSLCFEHDAEKIFMQNYDRTKGLIKKTNYNDKVMHSRKVMKK